MQILEYDEQRLVEALAQENAFNRFQSTPLPEMCIHLGQRFGCFLDAEEREHVGQRVLESAVEHQHLAAYLLTPLARVVFSFDLEIIIEEFYDGQIGRGRAVRDR